MFELPIGYPVLVCAQIGDRFEVFFGLALRPEDGYNMGQRYKGRISIVKANGGWGQNELFEVIHGIEHYSKRISATYWAYPDEIDIVLHDEDGTWREDEQQRIVQELAKRIGININA